ncbi:MAG: Mth938-like domain-containing protein [Alphaproteobacteria bacterium]
MDITPSVPESRLLIDSYGPGRFTVRGQVYHGPILITPTRVAEWPVGAIGDLSSQDILAIRTQDPSVEITLIGTGARMAMLPSALRQELRDAGLPADPMDTGAACRTFNILMTEGRLAGAALLPVETD